MSDFRKDDVVAKYIELRHRKEHIEARSKEELDPVNDGMKAIEAWLLESMIEDGVDSYKTSAGTAYRSERLTATLVDRAALVASFVETILELAAGADAPPRLHAEAIVSSIMDMFQARLKLETIRLHMADNDGRLPPGVETTRTATVNVRQ